MNRTRFTVTYIDANGERVKKVALCYTALDAQQLIESRFGVSAVSIIKGDYRKEARAAEQKASGGFTVDRVALAAAIKQLGITMPVKLRFNARVGGTQGNYRFRNGTHDIMLKSYHTPEQASSTLWHELTHAMQAERAGGTQETWNSFAREQRRYTYNRRPIEIEARQMSEAMAHVPLCR